MTVIGEVSEDTSLGRSELDFEDLEILYIDELTAGEDVDLDSIDIPCLFDEISREEVFMDVLSNIAESEVVLDCSETTPLPECVELSLPGLRAIPDKALVEAGRGEEKSPSKCSDKWALKRANTLRKGLGWDMSTDLGDLPLKQLDQLFNNLFSRVVKKDGTPYPSATLMGMMNAFNRIIRRASEKRSLRGSDYLVDRDFNINRHVAFTKTRMVLKATVRNVMSHRHNVYESPSMSGVSGWKTTGITWNPKKLTHR
ncbi:unnamed protein product [Calypogeia fissa]